jgi:CubicO group peptidase (beta-lactamase class C family)
VDTVIFGACVDLLFGSQETHGRTLALAVVQDGRLVFEKYDTEHGPDSTLVSWSMAKSITHALVGIAVGDGLIDTSADNLFPEWAADRRRDITLQHLLNMSSGLAWNEDYVDGEVSDVIEMLFGADPGNHAGDHASYAASRPLVNDPGTHFYYSSGTTNLVTRVLARSLGDEPPTNTRTLAFMNERLFGPVGMTTAVPKFDKAGTFVGSSYVYATARDFARFGWLYLNDGVWDGTRILPGGWVDHGRAWVASDDESGAGYGAHWWLPPALPGAMAAFGYEGQFTFVVPERDLVVVRLGKSTAPLDRNVRRTLEELVTAFPVTGGPADKSGVDV